MCGVGGALVESRNGGRYAREHVITNAIWSISKRITDTNADAISRNRTFFIRPFDQNTEVHQECTNVLLILYIFCNKRKKGIALSRFTRGFSLTIALAGVVLSKIFLRTV